MEEKKSKQVIVMRKDLNMRLGKQIAQGCHASLKVILDRMIKNEAVYVDKKCTECRLYLYEDYPIENWINGIFTKICVSVNSENELLQIYENAKSKNLDCALIQDVGLTEFGGIPTYTCCAIGPAWSDEIDEITSHLKLL